MLRVGVMLRGMSVRAAVRVELVASTCPITVPCLLFLGFYFASDDQGLFVFGILCWCCIQLLQNKTWKEDRFKP